MTFPKFLKKDAEKFYGTKLSRKFKLLLQSRVDKNFLNIYFSKRIL